MNDGGADRIEQVGGAMVNKMKVHTTTVAH